MNKVRKLPPLKAVLAFETAARLGSFTHAADELNVTQTAISHQVRLLEEYFGLKLFDRSRRDIVLTEPGQRLLGSCTDVFDQLDRATRDILSKVSQTVAPLRITLPPALGSHWLSPRLGEFWAQHQIELNLIPSSDLLDFHRDEIDLGIRCGDGKWRGLESEFLLPMNLTPICSPALLKNRPGLDTPADLHQYTLLHELNYDAWGEWLAAHNLEHIDFRRGVTCQDASMLYDLAMRGQGVALGSITVIEDALKAETLITPFGVPDDTVGAYYLVYRKGALSDLRVKAFRDFVVQHSLEN